MPVAFKKTDEDEWYLEQRGFDARAETMVETLDCKSPPNADDRVDDRQSNPDGSDA